MLWGRPNPDGMGNNAGHQNVAAVASLIGLSAVVVAGGAR